MPQRGGENVINRGIKLSIWEIGGSVGATARGLNWGPFGGLKGF